MKFKSNIELQAGLEDNNAASGTTGQVLSSTGTGVEWIDQSALTDVQSNFVYFDVKNETGSTINKGKGVMAVGTDGNSGHILIDEMVADGSIEPKYFLGVLETTVANGGFARVISFGQLDQFDTRGQNGETWSDGQVLWCDPDSNGDFTITEPDGPNVKIAAAFILNSSTNGKIQVRVQANEGIHDLHDTKITSQVDGDILVWDNTTGVWFNDSTLNVDYTNSVVDITGNLDVSGDINSLINGEVNITHNTASPKVNFIRSGFDTYGLRHTDGGLTIYNETDARKELNFKGNGNAEFGGGLDVNGNLDVSGTGSFSNNVSISNAATARLDISGGGNGYVNAAVSLRTTDDNTNRGNGIYSYNDARGIEWFFGNPYNTSDSFSINRRTSATGYNESTADPSYSIFTVSSNGDLNVSGSGTFGDDITIPNNTSIIASNSTGSETSQVIGTTGGNGIVIGQSARWNSTNIYSGGVGYTLEMDSLKNSTFNGNLDVDGDAIIDGNVGIGTTNPSSKLYVDGDFSVSGKKIYNHGLAATSGSGIANGITLNWKSGQTSLNSGYNYRVRLTTSGTGTNSGSTYLVEYNPDTTSWNTRMVSRGGSNSNHPLLAISGNTMVAYHNHATAYSIQYHVESISVSDNDGTLHNMGADYHWQRDVNELYYTDGNVGIGATSPDSLLELENSPAAQTQSRLLHIDNNPINNQGSGYIEISSGTNNQAKTQIEQVSSGGFGLLGNQYIDTNIINRGLASTPYGNINFATGSSTSATSIVMTIGGGSQKGNVGIGTTNPTAPLDVVGVRAGRNWALSGRANIRLDSNGTGNPADILFGHTAAANQTSWDGVYWALSSRGTNDGNKFHFYRGSGNPGGGEAIAMTIASDLNVGIGTTSPGHLLEVRGTSDALSIGDDTNTQTYMRFANSRTMIGYTGSDAAIQGGSGKGIRFNVNADSFNSGTAMYINSSGNVGIGTNSPQAELDVRGGASTTLIVGSGGNTADDAQTIEFRDRYGVTGFDNGQIGSFIKQVRDGTSGRYDLTFGTTNSNTADATEKMRLTQDGNVGIGTTSPGYKLDVNGGAGVALRLYSSADQQLLLNSPNSWTGIGFNDGAASGTDYIWHNGVHQTFAIGGGGSNVSGKKLHVHGAMTVGSGLVGTAVPTDGLLVQGNVGIGTGAPPEGRFEVQTIDSNRYVRFKAPNGEQRFQFYTGGTGNPAGLYMYSEDGTTRNVQISAGGTSYFNGGNVGIGTNSASAKLNIGNEGEGEFAGANSNSAGGSHLILRDEGGTSRTLMSGPSIVFQTPANSDGTNIWATSRILGSPSAAGSARGTISLQVRDNYDPLNDGTSWNWRTALTVINTGNVGIGTNSPGEKLDVVGNIELSGNVIDASSAAYYLDLNGTSQLNHGYFFSSLSFGSFSAGSRGTQFEGYSTHSVVRTDSDRLDFYMGKSPGGVGTMMSLTKEGNVGIGATNPNAKLEVSEATDTTISIASSDTTLVAGQNIGILEFASNNESSLTQAYTAFSKIKGISEFTVSGTGSVSGAVTFETANGNVLSEKMRITGTGLVGIGTDAPVFKLDVHNLGSGIRHYGDSSNQLETFCYGSYQTFIATNGSVTNEFGYTGGNFYVQTNDEEKFRITSAGNVGIGTTSPSEKLDVYDGVIVQDTDPAAFQQSTGKFYLRGKTAYDMGGSLTVYPSTWRQQVEDVGIFYGSSYLTIGCSENGGAYSEKIRIDSFSGSVAIGATNPFAKLHVVGEVRAYDTSNTYYANLNANSSWGYFNTNAPKIFINKEIRVDTGLIGSYNEDLQLRTSGTTRMYINNSSGNVGIGDTNPDATLTVFRQSSTYAINLSNTESRAGLSVKSSTNFDSKLTISSGASSRQYIQAVNNAATTGRDIVLNPYGGNVGIGDISPGVKLAVSGVIGTTTGFAYKTSNTAYDTTNYWDIREGSFSPEFYKNNSYQGELYLMGSDYRIKQNISNSQDNAIDKVKQLRVVNYNNKNFRGISFDESINRVGFIAHELQEVIPSAVIHNKDDEKYIQQLRIDDIVATLTKAVQEQQTIIEQLETRIQTLENK